MHNPGVEVCEFIVVRAGISHVNDGEDEIALCEGDSRKECGGEEREGGSHGRLSIFPFLSFPFRWLTVPRVK